MGFLAPGFLAGLVALGLPIWLHLLKQHKVTPKPFSSLMFFERRTQSSIKHRRLKYLLLMALRLAVLLFLILAFANPFIERPPSVLSGKRLIVLAVDNSFSMRLGDRLARAKREAASVLGSRGGAEPVQVVALGSQVQLLTQPTTEVAEAKAALEGIQPSDARSSYGELSRFLRTAAQNSRLPVEAHLFSDMQKTSLPPGFIDLRLADNTKLVLHAVAEKREPNWTVESVTAPRVVYDPKRARVQATVAGYGTEAAKRTVSLVVNGKALDSKQVDVPANGRATVEFLTLDASYGFQRGEVRIDSADNLPADNTYFFAVERADPRHILFVHEARQPRGVLYFKAALDSGNDAGYLVDAVTTDQVTNVAPGKYAVVILSDVGMLPSTFEDALQKYVRAGGSVWISAGPATASRPRLPVFDEAVLESRYASRGGERFQFAATLDATHSSIGRANKWENVKFYQAIHIDPGKGKVLGKLADDTPVLLEKQVGEGRVMVFASTFDNISNDFPLHPSFVPFVQQTTNYLSGAENRPSSYAVDTYVDLRAEKADSKAVEVLDPSGKRAMSLAEASKAQSFLLTSTGYYDVVRGNGRHELVAVNADRKESDLDLIPQETLALWQNTGAPAAGGPGSEQAQRQQSLGWYAMLLLALAALVESLFASRYLGGEPALAREQEQTKQEAA